MREDKIIAAWDKMNPDSGTKERILQQIQRTMEQEKTYHFKEIFRRSAIGFASSFILLLGSLGTAYAANPAFRDYVHSLLFPVYTSDEFVSISNGHMTGAFDETDVLLSFLDRFNRAEFGNSITAVNENGYHYGLFVKDDNQLQAFVESSVREYCIVVYLERLEFESTEGVWQVTGYQILENSAAEIMQSGLEAYIENLSEEMISVPEEDTTIKGYEGLVIIYNVNDKKNTVSLGEDDSQTIRGILDGCKREEYISGGLFQYVIKVNGISYMLDSKGNGMVDDSAKHWGITVNASDLDVIMELFKTYDVSLEETQ